MRCGFGLRCYALYRRHAPRRLGLPERQSLQHVAIAVYEDDHPVASALVAAHLGGFETGLNATSCITHATPREGTAEGSQQGLSCWQRPHLLLTVDHDCDGLTLPSKWDPRPFSATSCTSEHLVSLLGQCKGDGHKGYFATELLRQYGLSNATDDVGGMMDTYKRSGITALVVAVDQALAAKAGIHWSTTSHTSVDIDLYDAAGGGGGKGNRVLGRARMVLRSFVEQSE
ncbi:hypothetical protein MY4824_007687 [Beauveria thailandica]